MRFLFSNSVWFYQKHSEHIGIHNLLTEFYKKSLSVHRRLMEAELKQSIWLLRQKGKWCYYSEPLFYTYISHACVICILYTHLSCLSPIILKIPICSRLYPCVTHVPSVYFKTVHFPYFPRFRKLLKDQEQIGKRLEETKRGNKKYFKAERREMGTGQEPPINHFLVSYYLL